MLFQYSPTCLYSNSLLLSLNACGGLVLLSDLHNNQVSGTIPSEIESLVNLQYLYDTTFWLQSTRYCFNTHTHTHSLSLSFTFMGSYLLELTPLVVECLILLIGLIVTCSTINSTEQYHQQLDLLQISNTCM